MSAALDALRADRLALARLVELDFPEGVVRFWTGGPQTMTTTDGRSWLPLHGLGEISALEDSEGVGAYAFSIGLRRAANGHELDPVAFAAAVKAERRIAVYNRDATVYLQVLDIGTFQPVDAPIVEMAGVMSHVETTREGTSPVSIRVACENLWAEGRKPAFGYYTDADQQALFPGDKSLSLVAANAARDFVWPRD